MLYGIETKFCACRHHPGQAPPTGQEIVKIGHIT